MAVSGRFFCQAEDWILAATPFSFSQKEEHSSLTLAKASLLPQLILEQIADNSIRMTTNEEMLERTLDSLVTERQSLFLQLSKEVKTRDALILSETSKRTLKKKLAAQDEKIRDLKERIDENLGKTEKARQEVEARIKGIESAQKEKVSGFSIEALNPFSIFSQKKEENLVELPRKENVVLYKNDPSVLFVPSKEAAAAGYDSAVFEKAVRGEKIKALLTGKMTIYGDYVQVSAELYIYPGRKVTAYVTEIGNLNDCASIARNIASSLMPEISNSRKVELVIKTEPEELCDSVVMMIDGVVLKNFGGRAVIDSGRHILEFSVPGYPPKSIVHDFDMADAFLVTVPFEKEQNIVFNLDFKYEDELKVYSFGEFNAASAPGSSVITLQTSSANVLGQAVAPVKYETIRKEIKDEEGNVTYEEVQAKLPQSSFFFYVPYEVLERNVNFTVSAEPVDTAAEIDRRRIWTYRAYSALVISLPFTLYSVGRYNSAVNAYNTSQISSMDKVNTWRTVKNISTVVTCTCAGFFAFELVRYLRTASRVLPYEPDPCDGIIYNLNQGEIPSAEESENTDNQNSEVK